jgi:glucose-6-phosphate dehydrogenase assembly protein OpcA
MAHALAGNPTPLRLIMPPPALTEHELTRLGIEVPLAKVDKALKELWDQDSAKTRSSLINFAIYTEVSDDLVRNMELLESITAEHACRAILILNHPQAPAPQARAYINALCRPYQGQQVICSEQIAFLLEQGNAQSVQNIVFAHLDSDLPLVVWWQGSLARNFEERLYSRIDTLIIDSSRWSDPSAEISALAAALASETADFDVRDLSWTRSHFLRMALAGCFQDARALEHLPQVTQIHIQHASGQRMAALLLGGWIAHRLGGSPSQDLQFTRAAAPPIHLTLEEQTTGPALQSLTLTAPDLRVHIYRDADSRFAHVCASCPGHEHEEVYPADVESEAELIGEQLSRAGGRTLYASMIPLLKQMV